MWSIEIKLNNNFYLKTISIEKHFGVGAELIDQSEGGSSRSLENKLRSWSLRFSEDEK